MKVGRLTEKEKQIIKKLREQGEGYQQIAKVLGCVKDRVANYCRGNGLGGFNKKKHTDPDNSLEIFIEGLKVKTNDELEYISGYDNCDSNVLLKCKKCGHEYIKSAQFVRRDREYRTCSNCLELQREKERLDNIEKRELRNKQLELLRLIKRIKEIKERTITKKCVECGEEFATTKDRIKCCSEDCRRKYNNRYRDLRRRKKLKENGRIDYSVTLTRLIKRDKAVCKICGEKVDIKDYKETEEGYFIAGDNYPSIDHILPVAKGGTHTWDNVQLAHRGCNTVKSDNIDKPIQLKLFS